MAAEITGLVLAGGAGRRVGGRDKGLLRFEGTTLAQRVCSIIAPQVDELLLSCNRNRIRYAAFGYPLLTDLRAGFAGPLAGMEAALPRCRGRWLLVAPCDTPRLPPDLASRLRATLLREELDVCYARDDRREHYLCALLRREFLATLPDFLDRGGRAVRAFYATGRSGSSDFSDCAGAFANFNHGPPARA